MTSAPVTATSAPPARLRHFEHDMLGVLLAAALCSALVSRMMGWQEDASLAPPVMRVITLVGGSLAIALLPLRRRGNGLVRGAVLRLIAIVGAAAPIAIALHRSTNAFYTAPSLLDGMVALLVLHLASRLMRWIAVEFRETYLVVRGVADRAPPARRRRRLLIALQRPRQRTLTLPAVALADALASVSAWTLLAFWILVALERRHVASAVLVFTFALLVLECAMLVPDALAACGLLPRGLWSEEGESGGGGGHPAAPPPVTSAP